MRPTPDQLLAELGTVDSGTNWLPQPVAETLIGYARPVADTTIPPPQPSPAPLPAAPAPSAPAPPAPVLSAPAPPASAPSAPAPAASVPPVADPSGPEPPLGAPRAPAPATAADAPPPVPPPGDFFEGLYRKGPPPPKRPDVGRVPSTTTPLGWQSDLARPPRRRRRLGRVLAAGALVLVLAGAGVAALALTSRLHLGGQPTPPASSSPAAASPQAVVEAYFAAINAHQWRKVWNLGGKNFNKSYGQMVAGYRTTAHDVLTSIHAHGNVVTVHLKAHHTDGTVRTYRISYTVQDGVITVAHTKRLR